MVPSPDPSPDVVDTITKLESLLIAVNDKIFSSPEDVPESTSLPNMSMVRSISSSVFWSAIALMTGASFTGLTVRTKISS